MLALSAGRFLEIIINCLLLLIITGFIIYRIAKKSDDPKLLIFKWTLTLALLGYWLYSPARAVHEGGFTAFKAIAATALEGLVLAFIWRRNIANFFANPIGDLYSGGTAPQEARPFYSHAIALRNRGRYHEALACVRKELEKFPADLEGQLLLANIQAENLNDFPGAIITIERICNQPNHAPGNIATALNTLADWYLKLNQDRDAARETLQRIVDRFPESELSLLASQRIASLATAEHLLAPHDRKKFTVAKGIENLGLLDSKSHPQPAEADPGREAADLVEHLKIHPLDADSREKLALIYANHYDRMDLASDQLEQLITYPNQPAKRVVHWLNLLADLQISHGLNFETVRATIQRIIDLFPDQAAAEVARNRIVHLRLELKGKQKAESIKLGSYEQDIGLKTKR